MNHHPALSQIHKICKILGSLNQENWPEGVHITSRMNLRPQKLIVSKIFFTVFKCHLKRQEGREATKSLLKKSPLYLVEDYQRDANENKASSLLVNQDIF